jgi:hypothetical protein
MVVSESAAVPHPKSEKQAKFGNQSGLAAVTAQP